MIPIAADDGGNLSVSAALAALAKRGVTRLLVEGGGHVAAAFLRAGLVDRLVWFHAPQVIGGDGVPAVAGFGLEAAAPLRVVLDGRLRLPLTHDLVSRAKTQPSWLMTHQDGPPDRLEA